MFRTQALTIDQLLKKVNNELELRCLPTISERTLRGDINIFETDYNADFVPAQKSGKKRLYSYVDKNFYAFKSRELSDNEKEIIRNGLTIIEQIESLPGNINFEKIKLELCELVDYNPDNEHEFIVSPYALKEYNQRWYLICWNNLKLTRYYNIALDRIENILRIDNAPFIENTTDIDEYYEQAVGVTIKDGQPKEKVEFTVSGPTAKYIDSKPLHPMSKHHWLPNGDLKVTIEVVINYELEHLLLSYADSIKILSPTSLIEHHKELLQKALAKY